MRDRPDSLPSITREVKTACGNLFIIITFDATAMPFEVFAYMGKSGGCNQAYIDGIAIAISVGLRSGTYWEDFSTYLSGVRCGEVKWEGKGRQIVSCTDAIAQALKDAMADEDIRAHISQFYGGIPTNRPGRGVHLV